jgi:hypothetical protein
MYEATVIVEPYYVGYAGKGKGEFERKYYKGLFAPKTLGGQISAAEIKRQIISFFNDQLSGKYPELSFDFKISLRKLPCDFYIKET